MSKKNKKQNMNFNSVSLQLRSFRLIQEYIPSNEHVSVSEPTLSSESTTEAAVSGIPAWEENMMSINPCQTSS